MKEWFSVKFNWIKNPLVLIPLVFILFILLGNLRDKEIDDIFPFLDKGVGSWEKTSNMVVPRGSEASAVLMNDGNVLISGGNSKDTYLDSAEIYYPRENKFRRTGNLSQKRHIHNSFLLKDGRVAVLGGLVVSVEGYTKDVEMYDPKTGIFSITDEMPERFDANGPMLPEGTIFSVEATYNPITKKYKKLPKMNYFRYGGLTGLEDGSTLILGGVIYPSFDGLLNKTIVLKKGHGYLATNIIDKYFPKTNKFEIAGKLNIPRHEFTNILLPDGNVLIVGGRAHDKKLDPMVFDKNVYPITRRLARNQYYIYSEYLQEIEIYNTKNNTSKVVGKLNYAIGPRMYRPLSDLILLDNRYVFIANGRGRRDEIFDIKTNKIYPVKKMPLRMTESVPIKINENTVLFIGDHIYTRLPYGWLFKLNNIKE